MKCVNARPDPVAVTAVTAFSSSTGGGGGGAGGSATLDVAVNAHYRALTAEWRRKLHVLEAFNGLYFFNLPEERSQTNSANWGMNTFMKSRRWRDGERSANEGWRVAA